MDFDRTIIIFFFFRCIHPEIIFYIVGSMGPTNSARRWLFIRGRMAEDVDSAMDFRDKQEEA